MNSQQFIDQVVQLARRAGYKIEVNRYSQVQIDFGNKKLHSGHLERLFPEILSPCANLPRLIENIAPGRPCTHRPMRHIVQQITEGKVK